jgi:RNA polymerase sigma factor (TIGR02999 family)
MQSWLELAQASRLLKGLERAATLASAGLRLGVWHLVDDYHWCMSPPQPQSEDATLLMAAAASGDKSAADRLLPLVYEQLRQAAQLGLAGERAGHTLSATALVHEAYLKLAGPREVAWASRGHFYAAAAEAMRRILIDYARARGRLKRGPTPAQLERASVLLSVADLVSNEHADQIVRLDEAVRRLEAEDPDVALVVRLRFYAGLSGEETASALGKSPATVDRDWAWARAWLFRQLRPAGP